MRQNDVRLELSVAVEHRFELYAPATTRSPLRDLIRLRYHSQKKRKIQLAIFDPSALEDERLLLCAAREYVEMRRRRDKYVPRELVGEPGWNMLLALYTAPSNRVPTGSLTAEGQVSQTTGLRWIMHFEREGYVTRYESADDKRMTLVGLTCAGRLLIRQALQAMLRD